MANQLIRSKSAQRLLNKEIIQFINLTGLIATAALATMSLLLYAVMHQHVFYLSAILFSGCFWLFAISFIVTVVKLMATEDKDEDTY